jgi:pimeloyl-ACP methyl ester carboxylesterase
MSHDHGAGDHKTGKNEANPGTAADIIAYDDHGGSEPAVVLVHGLSCDGSDWQAQTAHFTGKHRVITCDLRGHGRSMSFTDGFDMPTAGADVVRLLRHLGVQSAVLAGHSMGCRVVSEAALQAPDIIKGVVLVDGSRFAAGNPEISVGKMRAAIESAGYATLAQSMFDAMFVEGTDPAISAPIIERAITRPPQIASAFMCAMVAWDAGDFERRYADFSIPMGIVQSTHRGPGGQRMALAPGMTVDWHEDLQARLGDVTVDRVYGAGHFTQIDTPQRVNVMIEAILANAV